MPRPAEQRLQATLAADLHTPADKSTSQDKTSAHSAPRSTSTAQQRTCPVRCHHAAAFHAGGSIAQGKASARAATRSTPTSSRAGGGSLHTGWPGHCPRQGQSSCCTSQHINFNAEHLSSAMPPRCNSSCQRNTCARTTSRRTSTSSYVGGGIQHASRLKHCPRQGKYSCYTSAHNCFKAKHLSTAMPPRCNALSP